MHREVWDKEDVTFLNGWFIIQTRKPQFQVESHGFDLAGRSDL